MQGVASSGWPLSDVSPKMITIYALKDPRDGVIRYVGKTKNALSKRLTAHRNEKRQTRKCRWLAKLRRDGVEPAVVVLEEVQETTWEESERFWIKWCRISGFDLTNHTDGGDGVGGLDTEARRRVSERMKIRMAKPGARDFLSDPARGAKISAALTGRPKSADHVAKLKQNQPGRKLSAEQRAAISRGLIGNQFRLGKPHDEITRAKISAALIGRPGTMLGKKMSEEGNLRRSLKQRGVKKSEEWKSKIQAGQLKYWAGKTKEERYAELSKRLGNTKESATK